MDSDTLRDVIDTALENADESQQSFFTGIEEGLKQLMVHSAKAPRDMYEHWTAFTSAINWHEPLFKCLLLFHVVLFFVVVLTRKSFSVQVCLFLCVCLFVGMAESLNSVGSLHWSSFATQNYFDKSGAFTGIFFNAPLLVILFFQLINFLLMAGADLVTVKRLQLKAKQKSSTESIAVDKKNS